MDSFSPLAAARVLVQALPVGPITGDAFDKILTSLTNVGTLRLGDLKVPEDASRSKFEPWSSKSKLIHIDTFKAAALPDGKLSFRFSTATRLPSTALLYPFETFREPFVILGVSDVKRFSDTSVSDADEKGDTQVLQVVDQLKDFASQLHENYPGALLHRILAIDGDVVLSGSISDVTPIVSEDDLRPFLLEVGGQLIPELGGLARSFEALQMFSSPLARNESQSGGDTTPTALTAGRRGSLQTIDTSQASADMKASYRMSMPAHLLNSTADDIAGSRSGSPLHGGRASPATTFEDITRAVPPQATTRTSTPPIQRESSADRGAAAAFGSDTLNERNRTRQQGRLACVVGSLYLQAGLWSDALRELSDGIAKARSTSDHLWHAKGYENAILCLLLLACNGLHFRVPDVCYPATSRPLAARGPQTPLDDPNQLEARKPEEAIEAIKSLYEMLPEMVFMAQELYQRTAKIPGESLPLSAYSEMSIRLARLLTGLSTDGRTDSIMQRMMEAKPSFKRPMFRRGKALARQASDLLHTATPPPPEVSDTSATETLSILGAIAACYAALGMARKSALVLQDYLDCLTPSLVQARKLGAAEAGMHPAAGIANFQDIIVGASERGMRINDMLDFFRSVQLLPAKGADASSSGSAGDISSNTDLRLSLLRRCIRVCEALPDFDGILECTSEFLRLAGPGSAPSLAALDVPIRVSAEEQSLLSGNFYRTSDLMDNLGLPKRGGRYWDDFLVRGVEIQPAKEADEMIQRSMTELASSSGPGVKQHVTHGPFLHDATTQRTIIPKTKAVLVVGEASTFKVVLQNLYDFDVYIDTLELITSQDDFRPLRREIRLSPRRIQVFNVTGKPQTPGSIRITGCRVTVKGCASSDLEIITEQWSPPESIKIFPSDSSLNSTPNDRPKNFVLEATVLPAQPRLELSGASFAESALEVHEGEATVLTIDISNTSKTAAVNFIKATSQDNIGMYLLSALKERDLQPPLRYEIERQLYVEPVLRLKDTDLRDIASQETKTLHFELLGKPGLTHLTLLLDYAYVDRAESNSQIFTRVLPVPITITTRPSVRLAAFQLDSLPQGPMTSLAPRENHCWMTLSFQNISTRPIEAVVGFKLPTEDDESQRREVVPSKSIATVTCIIPKIYVEKSHAIIPSLDPSKEQQFVVRTSGGAPIDDRDERERFWYGNELLNLIRAAWQDPLSGASGSISLRDIVLSPTELQTLRLDDLSITWEGEARGQVAASSTIRLKLVNRSNEPMRVELQLRRALAGFVDRVAAGQSDSQLLSVIKPHSEATAQFEVTFDSKGHHVLLPTALERVHAGGKRQGLLRAWHGEPSYVIVS